MNSEHIVHLLKEKGKPETVCGEPLTPEPTTRGTVLRLCSVCGHIPDSLKENHVHR